MNSFNYCSPQQFDPYTQYDFDYYAQQQENSEPFRQPPALERRVTVLEQENEEQKTELTRLNKEILRQNQEIKRLNQEICRINRDIDRQNENNEERTRRLNRLNQRICTVENRMNIPFSPEDGHL